MNRKIVPILLACSVTVNLITAVALIIVVRSNEQPLKSGSDEIRVSVEIEAPELPLELDSASVTRFLNELGMYFEGKERISSRDPAGVQLRFLWPEYAEELREAFSAYRRLRMFTDGIINRSSLPAVETEVLIGYLSQGLPQNIETDLIRELVERGNREILDEYARDRIEEATSSYRGGGYVNISKTIAEYAIEAGIPISDEAALGVIKTGGPAVVPILRYYVRTDPDRMEVLTKELLSSPHQLRGITHNLEALILLAEAGSPEAISAAAETASRTEYERSFAIMAMKLLIHGTPAGMYGTDYLDWIASQPVDSFVYDSETRR